MSIWHRLIGITLPQVPDRRSQFRAAATIQEVPYRLRCRREITPGQTRRLDQGRRSTEGEALAASVLSAMAGAVAVSRAISDKRLSDELLGAARASIKARLGLSEAVL